MMPFNSFQQVAVSTTELTAANDLAIPDDAYYAEVQATSGSVRYSLDGSEVDTSRGMIFLANMVTLISASVLRRIRFIRNGGLDAALSLHYYGRNDVATVAVYNLVDDLGDFVIDDSERQVIGYV